MAKNTIIRYSTLLTKFLLGLCILFFMVLTAGVILWHFDPGILHRVEVTDSFQTGYGVHDIRYHLDGDMPADAVQPSELSRGMVWWLWLRGGFFLVITVLILRTVLQVLRSIAGIHTFYHDNIGHFRRMARLGFIAFAVSCFNVSTLDGDFRIVLDIAFGPLLFAVACLVLAEVFREGEQLLQENNMII